MQNIFKLFTINIKRVVSTIYKNERILGVGYTTFLRTYLYCVVTKMYGCRYFRPVVCLVSYIML